MSGTDMPDDHHPLMPRRNPEDSELSALKAEPGVPDRTGHTVPQRASREVTLRKRGSVGCAGEIATTITEAVDGMFSCACKRRHSPRARVYRQPIPY